MKILLDLDGVIFDIYTALDVLHRRLFGTEINWKALTDGEDDYWKTKQGLWVRKMFNDDLFYAELIAYKGAREALRIFMRNPKNRILYCTARGTCLEEATAYSIGRNNLPYGDLIFVDRKNVSQKKLEIAIIESVDVAIDDENEIIFALNDKCITIIYSQPYNLKYPFGYRVDDWFDVNKLLQEIEKEVFSDEGEEESFKET